MRFMPMFLHKYSVFVAFGLSLFLTAVAHGAATCTSLFPKSHQSSVEVEISATPKVIELFTTTDGTIRPVTGEKGIEAIPEAILKALTEFVGPGQDRSVRAGIC